MKISALIEHLRSLAAQHGDLEIYIDDWHTSWLVPIVEIAVRGGVATLGGDYLDDKALDRGNSKSIPLWRDPHYWQD